MFGIIAGIVSAAVGVISSIASSIGPAVAAVATTIAKLAPTLEKIITVANVISGIAQLLGVLEPDENPEDIGAKAMQEGTRPRMPDESPEEYLNYLKNDVELDKEKQLQMDEKDRLACIATGSAIVLSAIAEKENLDISPEYVSNIAKAGLAASDALKIASKFKENNIEIDKFNDYFNNALPSDEISSVNSTLKESISEIHPDMSEKEIRAEISNMGNEISKQEDIHEDTI